MCLRCRKQLRTASPLDIVNRNIQQYKDALNGQQNAISSQRTQEYQARLDWLEIVRKLFAQREQLSPRYKINPETGKQFLAGYRCTCGSLNLKKLCVSCDQKFQPALQAQAKKIHDAVLVSKTVSV